MGKFFFILLTGAGLAACASTSVKLEPIGPCSTAKESSSPNGKLQVFSSEIELSAGADDLVWNEHSAYSIYNEHGERLKTVRNKNVSLDTDTPETVTLPVGRYTVRADADGYRFPIVQAPVVIESGKTTIVHLEPGWSPSECHEPKSLVYSPAGFAVGWAG